ncbi:MAG: hypothetical protein NVSMB56_14830 [Pyrinomonadaceae bacterium]
MDWMNQIGGLLQQYTGGQQGGNVHEDFDQAAQHAPSNVIADGLAAAFRSNETPAFPQMLGTLFNQSSGEQKASMLNTLIAAAGPALLSQALSRGSSSGSGGAAGGSFGGLGNVLNLLSGGGQVTPQIAEQIPAEAVEQVAAHAEQQDPSIIDKISSVYAEHPTLIKTLGGAALSIALAKMAQRVNG